jgi:uncharacterized membrane protein YraQ (UPF0718 family)/copper chaperone CopZ
MDTFLLFLENIWATTLALSFWLLTGFMIAGILHVWVPDNFVRHHLGHKRGVFTVFKAVIFGVPMPLCSCGVIPAALGIKKQGAGDGAAIGFLISTPQTGVDSIMVSASMLGWPFAVFKLLSAFVIGIVGGCWAFFTDSSVEGKGAESSNGTEVTKRSLKDLFPFAVDDLFKMIWRWLVAGIFISAAITTWLPADFFQKYLPDNIFIAMLLVLLISLPMYVCATASVPIAAALVATGMPTGAALVFLMAGPASNIATIGAVYRAFGLKKLIIYLSSIIAGSMIGGYLFNSVIIPSVAGTDLPEHKEPGIVAIIAGIVFIILILRFIIIELKEKFKAGKSGCSSGCCCESKNSETKTVFVGGMSCEGCAGKLKKALLEVANIATVQIDIATGEVKISGSGLSDEVIRDTVSASGFTSI